VEEDNKRIMEKDLWMKPAKLESDDKEHWVKLRIKKDKEGNQYIDVLSGAKGNKTHSHYALSLDQRLIFIEPRDQMHSLRRVVESAQKGLLDDKTIVYDEKAAKNKCIETKILMDEKTREVKISSIKMYDKLMKQTA